MIQPTRHRQNTRFADEYGYLAEYAEAQPCRLPLPRRFDRAEIAANVVAVVVGLIAAFLFCAHYLKGVN
jgi:hypothetical protein